MRTITLIFWAVFLFEADMYAQERGLHDKKIEAQQNSYQIRSKVIEDLKNEIKKLRKKEDKS